MADGRLIVEVSDAGPASTGRGSGRPTRRRRATRPRPLIIRQLTDLVAVSSGPDARRCGSALARPHIGA
jgi:hypothetical protein